MTEKTLAIIKPDAVKKRKIGSIISIIESHHFNISKMKLIDLSTETLEKLYKEHVEKSFYGELVSFMQSGKILVLVLEKENAIKDWRALMGATNPADAKPGTIRCMFGNRSPEHASENVTHGSDSPESAKFEIGLFFKCSKC